MSLPSIIVHGVSDGRFLVVKMIFDYMTILFISIGRMPSLAHTLDKADPLFAPIITSGTT